MDHIYQGFTNLTWAESISILVLVVKFVKLKASVQQGVHPCHQSSGFCSPIKKSSPTSLKQCNTLNTLLFQFGGTIYGFTYYVYTITCTNILIIENYVISCLTKFNCFICSGALTHSVKALDISLKIDTELALQVGRRTNRA